MPTTNAAIHRAARLRWREQQLQRGLCIQCTQPRDPRSSRYCSDHRDAYNRYRRAWRASWRPRHRPAQS